MDQQPKFPRKGYEVTVSRLISQECVIAVHARGEEEAEEIAVRLFDDGDDCIAEAVWQQTDDEPHSFAVERVKELGSPEEV